ncbi:hypothetical protein [Roseovarius sp.]|uniref:hypothetical protein n=1 Tax=Roseovarius sp. TaxID=1486281 RepID=UPI003BACC376
MRHLLKPFILACAALAPFHPALADTAIRTGHIPATEQHQAIIDCKYELGLRGAPKIQATYVAYPWGGDTVLRILPHGSVGAGEAAWINACADARLGRAVTTTTTTVVRVKRVRKVDSICPPWASVLYRGSTYCVGN